MQNVTDMKERYGIAVAGSVILDKIKEIPAYPNIGELAKISSVKYSVGGCVPNVAIDMKRMRPDLEVTALGRIGDDGEGKFIIDYFNENGIDTSLLVSMKNELTSFTDVMSIVGGQRTFFNYPGAADAFGFEDVDFTKLNCKILHLGYFLLLKKIDEGDGIKILDAATKCGIKTSIDLVSENSDRYSIVLPALPYTDYLIINELEAGKLTGIEPTDENMPAIAKKLLTLGVREKVIIHMPKYAIAASSEGVTVVPSYDIPKEAIKGTTGAGDAFCAGALLGIYDGKSDKEILEFASGSAAISLFAADATSGLKSEAEINEICKGFNRRSCAL